MFVPVQSQYLDVRAHKWWYYHLLTWLWYEVVVPFVGIGGIVRNFCLNCVFIIKQFLKQVQYWKHWSNIFFHIFRPSILNLTFTGNMTSLPFWCRMVLQTWKDYLLERKKNSTLNLVLTIPYWFLLVKTYHIVNN